MPIPVELLRFFDRKALPRAQARPPADEAATVASLPPAPAAELPVLAAPGSLPAPLLNGMTA
jgi:hypothetical protein